MQSELCIDVSQTNDEFFQPIHIEVYIKRAQKVMLLFAGSMVFQNYLVVVLLQLIFCSQT